MNPVRLALLVPGPAATCLALRLPLGEQGVEMRVVDSIARLRSLLAGPGLPAVIFADTALPDGGWAEVVDLAKGAVHPVPVIVVSRTVQIDLYINALEKGAADFIVPPFYRQDIAHVLDCAARKGRGDFARPLLAV